MTFLQIALLVLSVGFTLACVNVRPMNHIVPGFELHKHAKWPALISSFNFIHATDTQLGMMRHYTANNFTPSWLPEMELTRKLVNTANSISPQFVVITGDLIDTLPDPKNETVTTERETQMKDLLRELANTHPSIAIFCVPGNHDMGASPSKDSLLQYRSKFGDDYYRWAYNGILFVAFNSQYWMDDSLAWEEARMHDAWVQDTLLEARRLKFKYAIAFQHIPFFYTGQFNEPEDYFNIPLKKRIDLLEQFNAAGIKLVFSGHLHKNLPDGHYTSQKDGSILTQIVTTAVGQQLGNDSHGYRLVTCRPDTVSHTFLTLDPEIGQETVVPIHAQNTASPVLSSTFILSLCFIHLFIIEHL